MSLLVQTDLGETFQFQPYEFTKRKTFEFARVNGFTGKFIDKDGKKKVIKKNGAEGQWTKLDVKKCPVVKFRTKKKNTSKFANKIAEAYFKEKGYKEKDYKGEKNDKNLIRKKDIVEWEKKKVEGEIQQFTSGAKTVFDEFENSKLLEKVLEEFFSEKDVYTKKARWGKSQVDKSIEYIEIFNRINTL